MLPLRVPSAMVVPRGGVFARPSSELAADTVAPREWHCWTSKMSVDDLVVEDWCVPEELASKVSAASAALGE